MTHGTKKMQRRAKEIACKSYGTIDLSFKIAIG